MTPLAVQTDVPPPLPPPVAVRLVTLPEHPCPYLPGRMERTRAFYVERLPGRVYHRFMDAGFRRSGRVIYQPACPTCRMCVPLRVPVDRFMPSKSQRRCLRRNADLHITIAAPQPTDEKHRLFQKYLKNWHGRRDFGQTMTSDRDAFESFLYESPVESLEFCYRNGAGELLAVGIGDVCPDALSSVYFYFDPDHARRSLGTFGALCELDYARLNGLPWYYLGFWVVGCAAMQYKSMYRPNQVLGPDGTWRENE